MADTLDPSPYARGRRYVTGVDAGGRSRLFDIGDVPESARWKHNNAEAHDFWVVRGLPAPLGELVDPLTGWTPVNRAPVAESSVESSRGHAGLRFRCTPRQYWISSSSYPGN
jgi:hypothetical protein